jgi:hypothetical protein
MLAYLIWISPTEAKGEGENKYDITAKDRR